MINLNMVPGNQIDVIWIMIIYLDNTTIYLSDADNQITLSGIPFDGKVIMHGSISELDKSINIIEGGGIGELGALSFGIARYTTNLATNDFFNEFYPATSRYVSGRIVDFGIVWQGATLLSQITWLNRYYIEDYFYNEDVIQLSCIEYDDIFNKEIPYYAVQKEFDNRISYFTNAPDESYGKKLPVLYGDFQTDYFNEPYDNEPLKYFTGSFKKDKWPAPSVSVNKTTGIYIFASHRVKSFDLKLMYNIGGSFTSYWRYIDSADVFMRVQSRNGIISNLEKYASLIMFKTTDSPNNILYGYIDVPLVLLGSRNTYVDTDLNNIYDNDKETYILLTLAKGKIYLKMRSISDDIGTLLGLTGGGSVTLKGANFTGVTAIINTVIGMYNPAYNQGVGYERTDLFIPGLGPWDSNLYFSPISLIGTYTGAQQIKDDPTTPWTFNELGKMEFTISSTGGNIPLSEFYLSFEKILILNAVTSEYIPTYRGETSYGYVYGKTFYGLKKGTQVPVGNNYGVLKGRPYDNWIIGRGATTEDLIENPIRIYESLIRDELRSERDLRITTKINNTTFICAELLSTDDDYYNGAIYHNCETNVRAIVIDYIGATKTITVSVSDPLINIKDNFFLTNIGDDVNIDITQVDAEVNKRDDWIFRRSIFSEERSEDLLNGLLYEGCLLSFNTLNGRKIIALDSASSVSLLTLPLYSKNRKGYMIDIGLTSLNSIYTDFVLKYNYHYGAGEYRNELKVDKNNISNGLPIELQTKCKDAEVNYRIKKKWEYSSNWITDRTTAILFLSRMVEWLTKQRLLIEWGISIEDGIKYEYGDQVKIDFDYMLPDAVRDYNFMVWGKKIVTTKRAGYIILRLLQMPEETVTFRITKDGKLRVTKDGKKRIIKGV